MLRKIYTAAVALTVGATLLVATPAYAQPVKPRANEGIISMTTRTCGSASSWRQQAAHNGITAASGYLVLRTRTYDIDCPGTSVNAPKPAPKAPSGAWVRAVPGTHTSSCYGWRSSTNSYHRGIDLPRAYGTRIRAIHSGRVVVVRYQAGGAGWYVAVSHGTYKSVYMHMRSRPPVRVGQKVSTGQTVGYVGSTGRSTGPHLHLEIHRGLWNRINPAPFLRAHGWKVAC